MWKKFCIPSLGHMILVSEILNFIHDSKLCISLLNFPLDKLEVFKNMMNDGK